MSIVSLDISQIMAKALHEVGKRAVAALQQELDVQGHNATGALSRSINHTVLKTAVDTWEVVVRGEGYARFVNDGVPASRIPFTPRRAGDAPRGGTSKYIQALKDWSQTVNPGLSEKEAMSMAFGIATKHSREGMPTRDSRAFSQNGRRTGFIDDAIRNIQKDLPRILAVFIRSEIRKTI